MKKTGLTRFIHVLPPIIFLGAAAVFSVSDSTFVYEPPLLLPLLNTAFLFVFPLMIAALAARTYLRHGLPAFVLYGCGMIAAGLGSFLAGWGLLRFGHNFNVTVHNVGSLVGALCHLGAIAMISVQNVGEKPRLGRGMTVLAGGYGSCVLVLLALSFFVARGSFPLFFSPDQGPTVIRQLVLGAATFAYACGALMMVNLHARTSERLFRLYAGALFLMAIGLGIVLRSRSLGSLMSWTGRAAQCAASLYFVAAVISSPRRVSAPGDSLPAYLHAILSSQVQSEVSARTRELSELNEKLRRSEERMRLAAEATGFGFYSYDFTTGAAYYSPEFLRLFGLPPDGTVELGSDLVARAVHPDDHAAFFSAMTAANAPRGSGILDLEYRIRLPEGDVRWLRVRGRITFQGNGADAVPFRANGIIQDVSAQKRAEEALRQSEQAYRTVADFTYDWEMWLDPEARIVYCSPSCERITGYMAEELRSCPSLLAEMVVPDHRPAFERHLEANARGAACSLEYAIRSRTGEIRWIGHCCQPVYGSNGCFLGRRVSNRDISDQKRVENDLRDSETMYRTFISDSLQGFAIIQDGKIVLCNEALCRLSGFSQDEAYRMSAADVLDTIHPEDRPAVGDAMPRILQEGTILPAQIIRLLKKDGTASWVEVLCARTTYGGKPALQLSYVDRTEERRANQAYHTLIDHALNGMAILQGGRIMFANQGLADICGYSVPELLSMSPEEIGAIVHEEDRRKTLAGMADRLAGRAAPPIQVIRFVHKNGDVRWVETQSTRIEHEGAPAVMVAYRDATAEKAAEAELESAHLKMRNLAAHLLRAREEERRKVAQEVHDQLGQTLAALKMDLHWLSKRLGGDAASLRDRMKATIMLSQEAIGTMQRIASDLRPRMLDDLGLTPALNWLGSEFTRRTGIGCKVTANIPTGIVGGNAATALYRIAQEALANVARHSHADHAALRLYTADGMLSLQVEDDGIGITEEQETAPASYGLIGMRERVEGLGGNLTISGETGFGTILVARIPIPHGGGLA